MPHGNRDARSQVVQRVFRRRSVAQLPELSRALSVSGRTVLRALASEGYLTSYSHAGKYYTLRHIPTFDKRGLWFHGEARFSKYGTLRKTVVVLVTGSVGGHTQEELAVILGVRVHDTLRSLVEAIEIGRVRIDVAYIYVAADATTASAQLSRREAPVARTTSSEAAGGPEPDDVAPVPGLDLARVIDVLVAVIHAPKDNARTITARLRAGDLALTHEQVNAVFEQYGLGEKKTARSRSRRSRR